MEYQRTAIITGAASGLGAMVKLEMERSGWTVISYDKRDGNDVREPNMLKLAALEGLDALINCAAINRLNWFEDVTEREWHDTLDTNVFGILRMSQACLFPLKQSNGTILNIVSNASHMPMRCSAAYNASKGAAHILTLQMARELYGRHGVTVFGVSPNRLAGTGMSAAIDEQVVQTRGWTLEEAQRYQRSSLPIGEETDPRVLAEFIAYLMSSKERHRYLHGCVIPYGV